MPLKLPPTTMTTRLVLFVLALLTLALVPRILFADEPQPECTSTAEAN